MNSNGSYDWNDILESDGQQFILLKEGDYKFTVEKFERGTFSGTDKTPTCNKVILSLIIDSPEGKANIRTDVILHKNFDWQISSFFRSIGLKKHGEKMVMDWNKVNGAVGMAHIKIRDYVDKKTGEKKQTNDVDRFLDYNEKALEVASALAVSGNKEFPF